MLLKAPEVWSGLIDYTKSNHKFAHKRLINGGGGGGGHMLAWGELRKDQFRKNTAEEHPQQHVYPVG